MKFNFNLYDDIPYQLKQIITNSQLCIFLGNKRQLNNTYLLNYLKCIYYTQTIKIVTLERKQY